MTFEPETFENWKTLKPKPNIFSHCKLEDLSSLFRCLNSSQAQSAKELCSW